MLAQPPDDPLCLLEAIDAGIQLRRRLERGEQAVPERRAVLEQLCRLQDAASSRLADVAMQPGTPERARLVSYAERLLESEQAALGELLTEPDLDPAVRAALLDRFQLDLEWVETLVARLEGEIPPARATTMERRLQRVGELLTAVPPAARTADWQPLFNRQRQAAFGFLERRARVEADRAVAGATPVDLWVRRLGIGRLLTDIEMAAAETPGAARAVEQARSELAERRARLVEQADELLANTAPLERFETCENIVVAAREVFNETTTFLEEVPLRRAVRRLELLHEDFDRLAMSSRRWEASTSVELAKPHGTLTGKARWLERWTRDELQEKRLALRLERRFGKRFVGILENTVLVLIVLITGLILAETLVEQTGALTSGQKAFFAWADLLICTAFLGEFFLKLALVQPVPAMSAPFLAPMPWLQGKCQYLRRAQNWLVGLLASIPYGFIAHHVEMLASYEATGDVVLVRLLRFLRLPRLARYVRLLRPLIRLGRLVFFALRGADHLVRRYADLFNRNIVLFEPAREDAPEERPRHLLGQLREHYTRRSAEAFAALDASARLRFAAQALSEIEDGWESAPAGAEPAPAASSGKRQIPVEVLVARLIEMSPDRIIDELGRPFAEAVHRYLRLLDAPLVRRLPTVRELLRARAKGVEEAAALAANVVGHAIQSLLNVVYFFADLQATISPPIFLDRLGATMVRATIRPARNLVLFVVVFGLVWLLVAPIPLLGPVVDWLRAKLAAPVIVIGVFCFIPLFLGRWLRKIANQASEFCERIVEAQFAAQTKAIKTQHEPLDMRFLTERVLTGELALRACDDRQSAPGQVAALADVRQKAAELAFLHNVQLLYQEYLDGSLFHRSDTKTSTQLLGNLALYNFRNSRLGGPRAETKGLEALDLNRAGGLLGGPYLWFNYITRLITQETARLLVEYSRHAIPLERLACCTEAEREGYRSWLARRLGRPCESLVLPAPLPPLGGRPAAELPRHDKAGELFETVEFTALDFLTDDPPRDRRIAERYGADVAELVRRDRRRNVRRAFRSLPLHHAPIAHRTVNVFVLYETYLAGGRVLVLPFRLLWAAAKLTARAVAWVVRVVRELLRPQTHAPAPEMDDPFYVAERKIHRMRKPVFLTTLWLRARFDVEYLGLSLPGVPLSTGNDVLLENDLDFISASRRDRLAAARLYHEQHQRLVRIAGWLDELGLTYRHLGELLPTVAPHLSHRSAEVLRALVTAFIIDYDDVYALAASIDGMRRLLAHAAAQRPGDPELPVDLPDALDVRQPRWRPAPRCRKRQGDWAGLFALACLGEYPAAEQKKIGDYLKRHWRLACGWTSLLLGQGGPDPCGELRRRLTDILVRTDLWSDQIIALRTVQTLTMLDVYHYCEMVWKLGGYAEIEGERFANELPFAGKGASAA